MAQSPAPQGLDSGQPHHFLTLRYLCCHVVIQLFVLGFPISGLFSGQSQGLSSVFIFMQCSLKKGPTDGYCRIWNQLMVVLMMSWVDLCLRPPWALSLYLGPNLLLLFFNGQELHIIHTPTSLASVEHKLVHTPQPPATPSGPPTPNSRREYDWL